MKTQLFFNKVLSPSAQITILQEWLNCGLINETEYKRMMCGFCEHQIEQEDCLDPNCIIKYVLDC